jgi:hypothetical protein
VPFWLEEFSPLEDILKLENIKAITKSETDIIAKDQMSFLPKKNESSLAITGANSLNIAGGEAAFFRRSKYLQKKKVNRKPLQTAPGQIWTGHTDNASRK